ncbi:glycosyltransferase [Aquimarina sp. ERC-38]|uniref:glycosyltransferase n=1 Tax=Aquimarina sp. ERC-38 TaxID=2949996 RepID=UPI002247712B|nr:glycosyltransferase [Aquimarina sp. ERC-38]UZO81875.1 glycosyltransferase [Aquimarina sp. ERC-38]
MFDKRILIVSGYFPYPTLFGGTFDIWERIKGIKQLGCEVDLIYTYKSLPKKEDLLVVQKHVEIIGNVKRVNNPFYLLHRKPLQVVSRKELKSIQFKRHYDIVVLESESVGEILENKTLKRNKTILRVHNNEAKFFKNLARSTSNFFKKFYYRWEAKKYESYSKHIYRESNKLWFISLDELNNYLQQGEKSKSVHLPPPINDTFLKQSLGNHTVLYVGALFMDNNLFGILWYLENIHDKISNMYSNYRLLICGSTGNRSEDYFKNKFGRYNRLDLYLNLKDITKIYTLASVFINPVFHGAGVKLKSINAIVKGLPLVTTSIGAEGIGLVKEEMFFLANNKDQFIESIEKSFAKDNQEMVEKAQNHLKSNHYLKILKEQIQN